MEEIKFSDCSELLKPDLVLKDIKRIIKEKTGIIEQNQRFHIYFNYLDFFYYRFGIILVMSTRFGITYLSKYMIRQGIKQY